MFTCISRVCCCSKRPKNNKSNYFFDPKVVTFGLPKFEPEKTHGIVPQVEFEEIRRAIIDIGGSNLKISRAIYYSQMIIGTLNLLYFIIIWILEATSVISQTNNWGYFAIALTILANMILKRFWKIYMERASEDVQTMFDRQNMASYNVRGISWNTRSTLLYIHIRIFDPQLRVTGHLLTMNNPMYFNGMGSQAPTNIECETPSYIGGGGGRKEFDVPLRSQFHQEIELQVLPQSNYQAYIQDQSQAPIPIEYKYPAQTAKIGSKDQSEFEIQMPFKEEEAQAPENFKEEESQDPEQIILEFPSQEENQDPQQVVLELPEHEKCQDPSDEASEDAPQEAGKDQKDSVLRRYKLDAPPVEEYIYQVPSDDTKDSVLRRYKI